MRQEVGHYRYTCDLCGVRAEILGVIGELPNGWVRAEQREYVCGFLCYMPKELCSNPQCQKLARDLAESKALRDIREKEQRYDY